MKDSEQNLETGFTGPILCVVICRVEDDVDFVEIGYGLTFDVGLYFLFEFLDCPRSAKEGDIHPDIFDVIR